jgi:hypothetical protein
LWAHRRLPGAHRTAHPAELRRFARKRNLLAVAATKQPAGQITEILSSPLDKNIPLNLSGKSVI